MKVSEAIKARRAVKWYDPEFKMPEADKQQLFELALQAPTAFNIQNWRFVVVEDPALRSEIRKVSWDQAQVTDASLLIVLCADLVAWKREPSRYWANAPTEVQNMMIPAINEYYEGREQVQRDEAMRSCGIVAQNLMLSAKELGYESCPMDGFDFDAVAKLINLPEDHVIAMFVVIGKGVKEAWPKPGQLPLNEVLIRNTF